MLNEYLQQTQRFLRDAKQEFLNPADLISYVNRARRETAMRAQCVRRLTPIAGQIVSWSVTNAGSGYTGTPTLTITAPDFPSGTGPFPNGSQATAAAIVSGGTISGIDSTYGGYGYFQPQMTIVDSTGVDATAEPVMSSINQLVEGQEVYNFSDVDVSMWPGVQSIYWVQSVSIIFSNYRYSLPMYSFSVYQSQIRQYTPNQYQYVATFASQYGQGTDGSIYMYPPPSQFYQMEWDCLCLPSDLMTNGSDEAIPNPWRDAVSYFAAALAYEELQNLNAANYYYAQFDKRLGRYSQYARPGRVTNPYGRW